MFFWHLWLWSYRLFIHCFESAFVSNAKAHYLDAMDYRLSHLQGKVARDTENLQLMASLGERLEHVRGCEGVEAEEVDALRFALEDLRVALFAQPMSRERTSVKRVNAAMAAVERDLGLV